jgi:hypothetical protein
MPGQLRIENYPGMVLSGMLPRLHDHLDVNGTRRLLLQKVGASSPIRVRDSHSTFAFAGIRPVNNRKNTGPSPKIARVKLRPSDMTASAV